MLVFLFLDGIALIRCAQVSLSWWRLIGTFAAGHLIPSIKGFSFIPFPESFEKEAQIFPTASYQIIITLNALIVYKLRMHVRIER